MTTIAYKDNIIAVDSRITCGSTIYADNYNKTRTVQGVIFVVCGLPSDLDQLINLYFGGELETELELNALCIDQGRVYDLAVSDRLHQLDITGTVWASGSGADHAFTAMDLGLSAKDAIKMAAKRDTGTGGKIRTLEVK